ncbi:hypothetical protein [Methylobacterium sp. GXS13]|uniref:hypothetical protein n=1 Tax=Methylobacterium sp. GXS13 TaxID=1730094 RepID=UPI00329A32CD
MTRSLPVRALWTGWREIPRCPIRQRPPTLDYAEQVARVLRSNAETEKFVAEQRKLIAEQSKLQAETLKIGRDRVLAPLSIGFVGMAAAAAFFGAGAAFVKLLGP